MHDALALLDQRWAHPAPWWTPYLSLGREILAIAQASSILTALNTVGQRCDSPVRFVEHTELPPSEAYEAFIYRTKCVPTRQNFHDLFNALVWMRYPRTKQRLNQLQSEQISVHGTSGPRGALRDALTLFDENAGILQAPAGLIDALRCREWQALFVDQRAEWKSARILIFGHALLEKLIEPRKNITAHVWIMEHDIVELGIGESGVVDSARSAEIDDAALSESLNAERLANKPFAPLPVLGVPGWWTANESPVFYEDQKVFRPARISMTK
jgi:hypothetical protein